MYRKEESAPSDPENFKLPFGGSLAIENRWVMMATLVPWSEYEEEYAQNFTSETGTNESKDFKAQIEEYYRITGYYPKSVHVDKIYRTRENRAFCKERGIRLSGPPLGRPPAQVSSEKKKQAQDDEKIRSTIEGKFGVSKRRYGLGRVMTKLASTSQTAIAITFFVMNLSHGLQQLLLIFLCQFLRNLTFCRQPIIPTYSYTLKNHFNLSVFGVHHSSILA